MQETYSFTNDAICMTVRDRASITCVIQLHVHSVIFLKGCGDFVVAYVHSRRFSDCEALAIYETAACDITKNKSD